MGSPLLLRMHSEPRGDGAANPGGKDPEMMIQLVITPLPPEVLIVAI
jgi:hypothetical protein